MSVFVSGSGSNHRSSSNISSSIRSSNSSISNDRRVWQFPTTEQSYLIVIVHIELAMNCSVKADYDHYNHRCYGNRQLYLHNHRVWCLVVRPDNWLGRPE